MPEPTPAPESTEPVNPEVRFERSDVNVRAIAFWGGVVIVGSVIVHLLFQGLQRGGTGQAQPAGPAAAISQDRIRLPYDLKKVPAPRLQVDQDYELKELRQRDRALLDHYAWVDAKANVVRIPIDRAMELLSDPRSAATHGIRAWSEGK